MYRINGTIDKGWNGEPLWIPNIKFPGNLCFYNTVDPDADLSVNNYIEIEPNISIAAEP